MTTAATTMETEITDALALQQMESGFTGVALPPGVDKPGEKVVMETDGVVQDDVPPVGDAPAGEGVEEGKAAEGTSEETPVAPTELTPDEVRKALEVLQTIPDIQSKIDKLRGDAFGKIGGLERVLNALKEAPFGQEITVQEADLQELNEQFPETTKALAPALTRVLNKYKGTGVKVPTIDQDAIIREATAIADQLSTKRVAMALLTERHEDWPELVGAADSQTEFRTWVKAQGPEVEQEIFSSWDHRKLSKKLTEFKEHKKAEAKANAKPTPTSPAKQPDTRSARLAEAIQPRGGKLPPTPKAKTPEEEFEAGFASGPGGAMK